MDNIMVRNGYMKRKSMETKTSASRAAFTLVEMLVVVGVLGLLISLLTPAVLRTVRLSEAKKYVSEARTLESAIEEFFHDQKRWPLPVNAGNPKSKPTIYKDGSGDKKLTYKIYFEEDNWEVFMQLIGVDFFGVTKNYIDIDSLRSTPTHISDWPKEKFVTEVAPLTDLIDKNTGVKSRNNISLVKWVIFVTCPYCGRLINENEKQCCGVNFTSKMRRESHRVLRPYEVEIDLLNNMVKVR